MEALTVIELGLLANAPAWDCLEAWSDGRKTQGELRMHLERSAWPTYGSGLWHEPWATFAGSLARAVQPCALLR